MGLPDYDAEMRQVATRTNELLASPDELSAPLDIGEVLTSVEHLARASAVCELAKERRLSFVEILVVERALNVLCSRATIRFDTNQKLASMAGSCCSR